MTSTEFAPDSDKLRFIFYMLKKNVSMMMGYLLLLPATKRSILPPFIILLLVSLMFSSSMANGNEGKNSSFTGSIAVDLDGDLVLRPPEGGKVKINNFTELSVTKGELSAAKTQLNTTQANLSSVLSQLSSAMFQLNATDSTLTASQSDLSNVKVQLNTTQTDLSSVLTQLSSAMSRVDSLESLSDILPSSFTISGTPLTSLKSAYAYIGGNLTITNNQNLKSVSLPFLTAISGSLTITGNPLLSKVSLPLLSTLGGNGSAFYILIEHNAPTITVSLLSLDLTSLSYSISALNMSCTALVPQDCSQSSIFVLGGDLGNGTLFYSLSNPLWSTTAIPALNIPRFNSPAAAFCPESNTVYSAGGVSDGPTYLSSAAKLSLDTKKWSDIASMKTQRMLTAGLCLDDGESFMVCGGINNGTYLSSCELFSPSIGTWAYTQNMTSARQNFAMVLYNGKPVVLGGFSGSIILNSTEQYNPETNSWSTFPSFNTARDSFGAAVVLGKIFIAGGYNYGGPLSSVECYSNGTSWTTLSSPLPAGTRNLCATVSFQNKLVVLGGTKMQVDVFDPSNGTWSTLPTLSSTYYNIASVVF